MSDTAEEKRSPSPSPEPELKTEENDIAIDAACASVTTKEEIKMEMDKES